MRLFFVIWLGGRVEAYFDEATADKAMKDADGGRLFSVSASERVMVYAPPVPPPPPMQKSWTPDPSVLAAVTNTLPTAPTLAAGAVVAGVPATT
jgi:hypothetical protein